MHVTVKRVTFLHRCFSETNRCFSETNRCFSFPLHCLNSFTHSLSKKIRRACFFLSFFRSFFFFFSFPVFFHCQGIATRSAFLSLAFVFFLSYFFSFLQSIHDFIFSFCIIASSCILWPTMSTMSTMNWQKESLDYLCMTKKANSFALACFDTKKMNITGNTHVNLHSFSLHPTYDHSSFPFRAWTRLHDWRLTKNI